MRSLHFGSGLFGFTVNDSFTVYFFCLFREWPEINADYCERLRVSANPDMLS
nr:MAG TPA: hypothetical protein [Caudoviricetes sp.]DAS78472.1 MAG TPA: hypothetical protein [Caudoviricetes sp.]